MLLLSIYLLYSNVTYIYPVSCLVEIKLFQIVSNNIPVQTLTAGPIVPVIHLLQQAL